MNGAEEIALISPSAQLTETAQKVKERTGIKFKIVEAFLDKAVAVAQELEQKGIEIILTLPFTSSEIKKHVGIAVISIDVAALDLMEAVYKAKKLGKQVAYIAFSQEKIRYDFENFISISGIEIHPYYYNNKYEMMRSIEQAARNGIEVVIVTGACMKHTAEKMGVRGVVIQTGYETLLESIHKAQDILLLKKKERERARRLQAIIDIISDGIINIDQQGKITVVNPAAARMLGLSQEEIIGKSKDTISQLINGTGKSKIRTIGSNTLIVSRAAIKNEKGQMEEILALHDVTEIQRLEKLIRREMSQKGLVAKYTFEDIVGHSTAIRNAIEKARHYAKSDSTVLITGETGTGKELFAHSIHNESSRSNGPFVAINCATLPENLLESELFGYEPGTFTGARKEGKIGLFELSHGGTLFLDEIGDIPVSIQARLLRVLQNKEVRRLGGEKVIPIDVRIIAATNADLEKAIDEGKFRADLYYRLNVLSIRVPPLRERKEDIALLVDFFQSNFAKNDPDLEPVKFTDEMLLPLLSYHWPGNVRELGNVIERFMYLEKVSGMTRVKFIKSLLRDTVPQNNSVWDAPGQNTVSVNIGPLEEMEKELLHKVALKTKMKKSKLAEMLGISRTTLWKKLNAR